MAAASYEDASTSNNPNLSAIKARRIQEIDRFLANINYLISSPADMNNAAQAQSVIQNIKRWATVNLKWYHKLYDLFFLTGRESAEEVQFNFLNPVREALERLQNMDLDAQLRENPSFIQDQIQIIVDTTRQYRQRLNEPDQQIWFDIIEDPPDIDVIEATPDNAKPLFTLLASAFLYEKIQRDAFGARSIIKHLNLLRNYAEIPFNTRIGFINELLADHEFSQGNITADVLELLRGYQIRSRLNRRQKKDGTPVDWLADVSVEESLEPANSAKVFLFQLAERQGGCVEDGQVPLVNTSYTEDGATFNYCGHAADSVSVPFDSSEDVIRASCLEYDFPHKPFNDVLLYFQAYCTLTYTRKKASAASSSAAGGEETVVVRANPKERIKLISEALIASKTRTREGKRANSSVLEFCEESDRRSAVLRLARLLRHLEFLCVSEKPGSLFHIEYMHHIFEEVFPIMKTQGGVLWRHSGGANAWVDDSAGDGGGGGDGDGMSKHSAYSDAPFAVPPAPSANLDSDPDDPPLLNEFPPGVEESAAAPAAASSKKNKKAKKNKKVKKQGGGKRTRKRKRNRKKTRRKSHKRKRTRRKRNRKKRTRRRK
jgi:hypothetical protein